ncbi:hypothetical protein D918_09070 [Trichuris suis]|nr:hypothetical protein D918_09070 [Trichuris suis]
MGIKALLPVVNPACKQSHVSEFSGMSVAVDASTWLHKAAFGCSDMIARGLKTDLHVTYCMKRVEMLLQNGVRVVLVFDGANLPAKRETNAARNQRRKSMKEQGKKLAAEGKFKEAADCFRLATEVTFDMVADVIKACQGLPNVSCLVAPYEADAQLCFLSQTGLVDVVISEDSDLIPFGCTKVMFKMDISGSGQLYERDKLHLALQVTIEKFDFAKFRRSCILSGCDYVSNLPGIGIRKAIKFFNKVTSDDPRKFLKMIPMYLRMPKLVVTEEYIERFIEAENTFLYQVVFDPNKRYQVPLNPYPDGVDSSNFPYAGCNSQAEVAILLAAGSLNPHNMSPLSLPVQPQPEESPTSICSNGLDKSLKHSRTSTCAFVFQTRAQNVVCNGDSVRNATTEQVLGSDTSLNCESYSMYLSESADDIAYGSERDIDSPFSSVGSAVHQTKSSDVVRSSYFANSCELAPRKRFNPFKALSDTNLVKVDSSDDVMFSSLPEPAHQEHFCITGRTSSQGTVRNSSEYGIPNKARRSNVASRNLFQYFKSESSREN